MVLYKDGSTRLRTFGGSAMSDDNDPQDPKMDLPTKLFFLFAIVVLAGMLLWGISKIQPRAVPEPIDAVPIPPAAQDAAYRVNDRMG